MRQNLKDYFYSRIKQSYHLYKVANCILRLKSVMRGAIKVENHGHGHFKKDIIGHSNYVYIGSGTMIHNSRIRIRGNNNRIVIGNNCILRNRISFWIEGNDCSIILGDNITFQHSNHFNCQEDGHEIVVGDNCMFSNNIIVRTSDSHPIYDLNSGERLNSANDVHIGSHVWVAPNSRIMKGACIDNGSVIGSNTMVTKHIPSNVLAVGMPARIVKENIRWEKTFS